MILPLSEPSSYPSVFRFVALTMNQMQLASNCGGCKLWTRLQYALTYFPVHSDCTSVAAIPELEEKEAWLVLAWVSTVAGNLTLLGWAANLIFCEPARRSPRFAYNLIFRGPLSYHCQCCWTDPYQTKHFSLPSSF